MKPASTGEVPALKALLLYMVSATAVLPVSQDQPGLQELTRTSSFDMVQPLFWSELLFLTPRLLRGRQHPP